MDTFNFWNWLFVITLSMGVALALALTSPAIVVKSFYANTKPRGDGVYVEIIGRRAGVVEWLFALLKIDATLEMRIRFDKIEYLSTNLSGFNRVVLPIYSVSSVYFGVFRPWLRSLVALSYFLVAAYYAAVATSTGAVLGFIAAGVIVSVLIFILARERSIGFSEVNGKNYVVRLKRSVIEGKEIGEQDLEKISKMIIELLDLNSAKGHKPEPIELLPNLSSDEVSSVRGELSATAIGAVGLVVGLIAILFLLPYSQRYDSFVTPVTPTQKPSASSGGFYKNSGSPSKYPRCAGSLEKDKCEAEEAKLHGESGTDRIRRQRELDNQREQSMREVLGR